MHVISTDDSIVPTGTGGLILIILIKQAAI
jgi:hypothetical protein